ncbi:MAG: biotin synthase BioB [Nitrospira sp. SB0675_bin_23]|nr:biotin synthase BioB [Nitrospira sp. SB0667_bin_9]MYD31458.1 biotin synthase BioB [Nitrospira sp. SB0661_bin_20]MYH01330.1 biotin synthase BioB [Nitrospira sp. SB0675_bin_23]MYJ22806.1 biotin synthase BioB [Nitrospira sp. SB0673_bin_12]
MTRFDVLAEQVLAGHPVTREEGLELLRTGDAQLLPLVNAAYTIRHAYFGRKVTIQMLFNAKSGACQEDCHYCSQSSISTAPIDRYALVSPEDMLKAARQAHEAKAERYCVVISGRSPLEKEVEDIASAVTRIKQELPMQVCCSLGLLTEPQARRLKAAGVDRINHNLNTSEAYHSSICTTHTYQDRMTTLRNARAAGLELCSGGIVGMGESDDDLVDLAFALKDLNPDSIPLNMLHPIPGTPLADAGHLTPQRCLKILCLFRFVHPQRELRAAGGREFNLRSLQPMALYVADSLFVNGYLTTPGDPAHEVEQMLTDLGFEVAAETPTLT